MKVFLRDVNRRQRFFIAAVAAIAILIFAAAELMTPSAGSQRMAVAQLRAYIPSSYLYPDGCPVLQIVNVRGTAASGDHGNSDTTTNDFSRDFVQLTSNAHYPKPANQFITYNTPTLSTLFNPLGASHDLSSGVTSTNKFLLPMLKKCPTTIFLLDGYSFGAWILKDVYNALPSSERKNVLLVAFGDPTFDPFQSADDAGTYHHWLTGIGKWFAYTGPYTVTAGRKNPYAGYTGPQVLDTCLKGDLVCQGAVGPNAVKTHFSYTNDNPDGWVQKAAQWAFNRWDAGIPLT